MLLDTNHLAQGASLDRVCLRDRRRFEPAPAVRDINSIVAALGCASVRTGIFQVEVRGLSDEAADALVARVAGPLRSHWRVAAGCYVILDIGPRPSGRDGGDAAVSRRIQEALDGELTGLPDETAEVTIRLRGIHRWIDEVCGGALILEELASQPVTSVHTRQVMLRTAS